MQKKESKNLEKSFLEIKKPYRTQLRWVLPLAPERMSRETAHVGSVAAPKV